MTQASDLWDWGGDDGDDPAVEAHRMVEAFINALTREHYAVRFAPGGTAATNLGTKKIVITSAPLYDKAMSTKEKATILSGMACHEISHTRYGLKSATAVTKAYKGQPDAENAWTLGNVLDDIRIERAFQRDYPGFADVFDPTLEWVSRKQHGTQPTNPLDACIRATRYDRFTHWPPDLAAERLWWQAWGERWGAVGASVKDHLSGIAEGLLHLEQHREKSGGDDGGTGGGGGGDSAENHGEAGAEADGTDGTGGAGAPGEPGEGGEEDAPSSGQPASDPASGGGVSNVPTMLPSVGACTTDASSAAGDDAAMQQRIDAARFEGEDTPYGHIGVNRAKQKPINVAMTDSLTATVRNAFLRSKGGHSAVAASQRSGALDPLALHRVGSGDVNVFVRRTAPSPAKYVFYFMVDTSGSMAGPPLQDTALVTASICDALRYVPTARAAVFLWKDMGGITVTPIWRTGEAVSNILRGNASGGTPDAATMRWAWEHIRKEARPGERPVIFMMSDGLGSKSGMLREVALARRKGVGVYSVALGGDVYEPDLRDIYGYGNYVAYPGTGVMALAQPLARLIATLTA